MQAFVARFLGDHRARILTRWEIRLRDLPPSSALATPDALVHLMGSTLDRLVVELRERPVHALRKQGPECPCGLNPLLAYFITAEAVVIETLFMDEPAWTYLLPAEREEAMQIFRATLRTLAAGDVEAFCSLCRRRHGSTPRTVGSPGVKASVRRRRGSGPGTPSVPLPLPCEKRG